MDWLFVVDLVMVVLVLLWLVGSRVEIVRVDSGFRVGDKPTFTQESMSLEVEVMEVSPSSVKLRSTYRSGERVIGEEEVEVSDAASDSGVQFFPGPNFPFPGVRYEGWVKIHPKHPDRVLIGLDYSGKGSPLVVTGIGWGT